MGNEARKHIGLCLAAVMVATPFGWTSQMLGGTTAIAGEKAVTAFQTIDSEELAEMLQHKDFPLISGRPSMAGWRCPMPGG